MPVPSQRQPRHPHSLSQFTGPRRFEHGNSSRKKRQDAPCNLALISATGFLVPFTSICSRFRDHKKNDRFSDNLKTGYGPSGHVSTFPKTGTTSSSIHPFFLHLGLGIVEFARVGRHERQVELTFLTKLDPGRARRSSRCCTPGRTIPWNVEGLADQFQSRPNEIKRFVRSHLESARTRELAERMRMAGCRSEGTGMFSPR